MHFIAFVRTTAMFCQPLRNSQRARLAFRVPARACACCGAADAAANQEPKRMNNLKLLLVFSTKSFDALVDVGSDLFSDLDAYRYLVGKPFSLHDASTQQTRWCVK